LIPPASRGNLSGIVKSCIIQNVKTFVEDYLESYGHLNGVTQDDDISTQFKKMVDAHDVYKLPIQIRNNMPNSQLLSMLALELFFKTGAKTYKIGEDFGRDLMKVNLNVPVSAIPKITEMVCIEFPSWYRVKDPSGLTIKSILIYQNEKAETIVQGQFRLLYFAFPTYDEDGNLTKFVDSNAIQLDHFGHFKQIMEEHRKHSHHQLDTDMMTFALNAYLYLHSGQPDLRFMKRIERPITRKPKKLKRFYKENEGRLYNYTVMGYDHKKTKQYQMDSWEVAPYLRWQPYGPKRSKYKLIFVKGHTRRPRLPIVRKEMVI
jgi:hypothetical protein